jgi:hypothetical protein
MSFSYKFINYSNTKKWSKGRRDTAPVKEAPAVYGSKEFLYAYGTPANVNQVGLLYIFRCRNNVTL